MPDVRVPKLDDHDEEPAAPAEGPVAKSHHRSKSFVKIGLEVVLISAGVFLGLMGEQWRERTEHRFVRKRLSDSSSVFCSILNYLGDVSYFDPVMLKAYNEVLVQIDRALGESRPEIYANQ